MKSNYYVFSTLVFLNFACIESDIKNFTHFSNSLEYKIVLSNIIDKKLDPIQKSDMNYLNIVNEDNKQISGIFAGPYKAQYKNENVNVLFRRISTSGRIKNDLCFLIINKNNKNKFTKTSCSFAEKIKDTSVIPNFDHFSNLSNDGKVLLTKLSNEKWIKKKTLLIKYLRENSEVTWLSSFEFSFIDNFSKMSFISFAGAGTGQSQSGATESIIERILEKKASNTSSFLVWISRPQFIGISGNKHTFSFIDHKIMNSKKIDEILNINENGICDFCSYKNENFKYGRDRNQISFQYIIINFDENKNDVLEVELNLIDDKNDTIKLKYYKE